jgi:hypothetical protein
MSFVKINSQFSVVELRNTLPPVMYIPRGNKYTLTAHLHSNVRFCIIFYDYNTTFKWSSSYWFEIFNNTKYFVI